MLSSLRSNPQTMSPYIQNYDGLCTRTDHHMLLPIVLHMVLEGWRAAITVGTNDGPLTGLSNR